MQCPHRIIGRVMGILKEYHLRDHANRGSGCQVGRRPPGAAERDAERLQAWTAGWEERVVGGQVVQVRICLSPREAANTLPKEWLGEPDLRRLPRQHLARYRKCQE